MSEKETDTIKKIISDDKCLKKILSANSDDEVKRIFRGVGIDLNDMQIANFKKVFISQIKSLQQIEDDEYLNVVDGGEDYKNATCKGAGYGCSYGIWIGAGLGTLAGMVDTGFKIKKGQLDNSWDSIKNILKFSILTSIGAGTASAVTGTGASLVYESLKK